MFSASARQRIRVRRQAGIVRVRIASGMRILAWRTLFHFVQGNRKCRKRAENSSPNMGEVREGEAAYRCETVIARFPHLGPPPIWGRRKREIESERACTRSDSEPALGPAAVQADILQQLAVQPVRQVWWRLTVQPPQRLVVRVAPEPSVGGGQTDVVVGNLRVTEQPGQESRMDRHDVLHLLWGCVTCAMHEPLPAKLAMNGAAP